MINGPKQRIHLNLSRHDATMLFGILTQAIDESTGKNDGLLLEDDLDCADRIAARLWDMLQDPRQARLNIFSTWAR